MCELDSHKNQHYQCSGSIVILSGIYLPKRSKTTALKMVGDKINFIDSWLKML